MKVTAKDLLIRGFKNDYNEDYYYKDLIGNNLCISYNFTSYGGSFVSGVFDTLDEEINVKQLQIETFRELDMFLSFFDAN